MKEILKEQTLRKVINVIFIFYALVLVYRFVDQLFMRYHYDHPGFSEFFINYQAGFVRRGLWGEILLYMCRYLGIGPYYLVVIIAASSFVFLLTFFIIEFKKRNYPLHILLMVFFVGGFVTDGGSWMRKDCILMIGFILSLMALKITPLQLEEMSYRKFLDDPNDF